MTTAIIIPARLASARLERKLLLSETGKPLIWHTYEACRRSATAQHVIVATPDREIADVIRCYGGDVVMTSDRHPCGTSRVAEAANYLPADVDLIVNVQGDEPALDASAVDALVTEMRTRPSWHGDWHVGTLAAPLPYERLKDIHTVKVAASGPRALYFSRAPLGGGLQHVGVYAYQRNCLMALKYMTNSVLMDAERLEQIYFLEIGWNVLVTRIDRGFVSVDTRADYDEFVRWWGEKHGVSDR